MSAKFSLRADIVRVNAASQVVLQDADFRYGTVEVEGPNGLSDAIRDIVTQNGAAKPVQFDHLTNTSSPYAVEDLRLPAGVPTLHWVYEVVFPSGATEFGTITAVPAGASYAAARHPRTVTA